MPTVEIPGESGRAPGASSGAPHVVRATGGLRLRSGPSREAPVVGGLADGAVVRVTARTGAWARLDGGYAHADFLRPLEREQGGGEALAAFTVDAVAAMFPFTPRGNIARNLPSVLDGLRHAGLADRPMGLMALATIRAESEGFVPVSEGRSRFNTRATPFDLYDAGTRIGRRLGNTEPGDGARFRGRGYVQLTGRFNYTRIGGQIGMDLVAEPERANEPETAGRILAQFLKNQESGIRAALAGDDLRRARRLVNGGSHGLGRFRDAFRRGERAVA